MAAPRSTWDTGGVVFSEELAWNRTQTLSGLQVLSVEPGRKEAGVFKAFSRALGTRVEETPLRAADVDGRGHP